jgi:hypothetical protein
MLIRRSDLDAIVAGSTDVTFRRWKRPTVKAGGTLRTALGVLSIETLSEVDDGDINDEDARRAGYASREELLHQLTRRSGNLYRIQLRWLGGDPRIELRNRSQLTTAEVEEIRTRLARYDEASRQGPWTEKTLVLIHDYPERRAGDLAPMAGWEKPWFKTNVRKLKNLGLTESLGVGYRLSPRGVAFLESND